MSRVERDHHYLCSTEKCVAPTPKRLTRDYVRWWLRTKAYDLATLYDLQRRHEATHRPNQLEHEARRWRVPAR